MVIWFLGSDIEMLQMVCMYAQKFVQTEHVKKRLMVRIGNKWLNKCAISKFYVLASEMWNFLQGQGNQEIVRRRT